MGIDQALERVLRSANLTGQGRLEIGFGRIRGRLGAVSSRLRASGGRGRRRLVGVRAVFVAGCQIAPRRVRTALASLGSAMRLRVGLRISAAHYESRNPPPLSLVAASKKP
jgi:hypothetical protein